MLITIDIMKPEDAGWVSDIEKKVFSEPWPMAEFIKAAESQNYCYITAKDNNKGVGYAGCVISIDEADITNIAVSADYRRLGIGGRLLTELERLLVERNVSKIFLEVRESNEAARELYTQMGFFEIGKRKNFYRKPDEDAILMEKDLQ
ncbi:MAG: ribosomal protein S18-alanine N-acetyltransferase [Butyrivibrio sp.]